MLNLTDFMGAVRQAIDVAGKVVSDKNLEQLMSYFHEASIEEVEALLVNNMDSPVKKKDTVEKVLKPKMVALRYQKDTAKGPVPHHVLVPLISLVPITNMQPQEITLELDLEFFEQNNELLIGFPRSSKAPSDSNNTVETKPNAKLTMRVNLSDRPAGLSSIIEGYDKNLRAQIPG